MMRALVAFGCVVRDVKDASDVHSLRRQDELNRPLSAPCKQSNILAIRPRRGKMDGRRAFFDEVNRPRRSDLQSMASSYVLAINIRLERTLRLHMQDDAFTNATSVTFSALFTFLIHRLLQGSTEMLPLEFRSVPYWRENTPSILPEDAVVRSPFSRAFHCVRIEIFKRYLYEEWSPASNKALAL